MVPHRFGGFRGFQSSRGRSRGAFTRTRLRRGASPVSMAHDDVRLRFDQPLGRTDGSGAGGSNQAGRGSRSSDVGSSRTPASAWEDDVDQASTVGLEDPHLE